MYPWGGGTNGGYFLKERKSIYECYNKTIFNTILPAGSTTTFTTGEISVSKPSIIVMSTTLSKNINMLFGCYPYYYDPSKYYYATCVGKVFVDDVMIGTKNSNSYFGSGGSEMNFILTSNMASVEDNNAISDESGVFFRATNGISNNATVFEAPVRRSIRFEFTVVVSNSSAYPGSCYIVDPTHYFPKWGSLKNLNGIYIFEYSNFSN